MLSWCGCIKQSSSHVKNLKWGLSGSGLLQFHQSQVSNMATASSWGPVQKRPLWTSHRHHEHLLVLLEVSHGTTHKAQPLPHVWAWACSVYLKCLTCDFIVQANTKHRLHQDAHLFFFCAIFCLSKVAPHLHEGSLCLALGTNTRWLFDFRVLPLGDNIRGWKASLSPLDQWSCPGPRSRSHTTPALPLLRPVLQHVLFTYLFAPPTHDSLLISPIKINPHLKISTLARQRGCNRGGDGLSQSSSLPLPGAHWQVLKCLLRKCSDFSF